MSSISSAEKIALGVLEWFFDNLSRTVELKSRVTTVIEPRDNSKNLLR